MAKLDLKKEAKSLYKPSAKKVEMVEVPPMNFLMIDGHGDPNTSEDFKGAVEALFAVSYTLKFSLKKAHLAEDYVVMPLEGLWWTESGEFAFENKERWLWTAMIRQPDFIIREYFEKAQAEVHRKKGHSALFAMRFENFNEGKAAQLLHVGPFSEERPNIEKLQASIHANGHKLAGKHHEIYLSDFRKTAPEKLRTIIRQPYI